ncbi:MAG: hypothetical protein WC700_17505 [Gemmatimonadaceae bacterium]|jgi:hypothetical protein
MKMLSGLKDAFTPKALKTSMHAMAGGGAAGVLHVLISKEVAWMSTGAYPEYKRIGLAVLIGTVGAQLLAKKSSVAAQGVTGAMGAVIAYELYNKARPTAQSRVSGMLSSLARTTVLTDGSRSPSLNGTRVLTSNFAGTRGLGNTAVRTAGTY